MSDERRAIEALRAGVPNRAAIRLLGTTENEISERFVENLQFCQQRLKDGEQATGQVIAGGFGCRQVASARIPPRTCAQREFYCQLGGNQQGDPALRSQKALCFRDTECHRAEPQ